MAAPSTSTNLEPPIAQVKRLVNTQLKLVCKGAGLPVSGAKAALQTRIISHLQRYGNQGNYDALQHLKSLIYNPNGDASGMTTSTAAPHPYSSTSGRAHYPYHTLSDKTHYRSAPSMPQPSSGVATRGPQFKHSPFFTILEPLTPVIECQVREANRDTVHAAVNLKAETVDALNQDRSMRVLIYCASGSDFSPFSRVDISFPHQIEIKVNQDEVKSNLRGLKNKVGSTRPADITDLLRKRTGYSNDIAITYALTKTRYYLVANLVKQHPAATLVAKLKQGKLITEDRVLREMASKAEDSDVIATSTILSLKCPLSTLRIEVPCRSSICAHNQCFDATSFLQLQEQAPTWTCPICNKNVSYDNLHLDQYVDGILKATPSTVGQVTIEPNGRWSVKPGSRNSLKGPSERSSPDQDSDLVEIQGVKSSLKSENGPQTSMLRTPPIPSREPSTSSASQLNGNSKRPAVPLVDLTLSSDEDDEPPREPKRQQTDGLANGVSLYSDRGGHSSPPVTGANVPHSPLHPLPPFKDHSNGIPRPPYS